MSDERNWQEWHPAPTLPFGLQTATGKLSLSAEAFEMLGQPKAVVLLYDASAGLVGLRAAADGDSNGRQATPAGRDRVNYVVSVRDFVGYHGIVFDRAMRFPAHDYGGGIIGFDLAEGKPSSRGGRAGSPTVTPGELQAGRGAGAGEPGTRESGDD